VKVFDGKSDKLTASTSVLVVGNKIEKIGGDIAAPENATVIDGGGRTLMPGLIEAHWARWPRHPRTQTRRLLRPVWRQSGLSPTKC